jgi:hypothetical protein
MEQNASFSRARGAARADSLAISEQDYSESPKHAEPRVSTNPIYHTLSASSPTAAGSLRCAAPPPAPPPTALPGPSSIPTHTLAPCSPCCRWQPSGSLPSADESKLSGLRGDSVTGRIHSGSTSRRGFMAPSRAASQQAAGGGAVRGLLLLLLEVQLQAG